MFQERDDHHGEIEEFCWRRGLLDVAEVSFERIGGASFWLSAACENKIGYGGFRCDFRIAGSWFRRKHGSQSIKSSIRHRPVS